MSGISLQMDETYGQSKDIHENRVVAGQTKRKMVVESVGVKIADGKEDCGKVTNQAISLKWLEETEQLLHKTAKSGQIWKRPYLHWVKKG